MPTIVPKTTIPRRSITAASSFGRLNHAERARRGDRCGRAATLGRISADGTTRRGRYILESKPNDLCRSQDDLGQVPQVVAGSGQSPLVPPVTTPGCRPRGRDVGAALLRDAHAYLYVRGVRQYPARNECMPSHISAGKHHLTTYHQLGLLAKLSESLRDFFPGLRVLRFAQHLLLESFRLG